MKRLAMMIMAISALSLAGCGMRGSLERPPPMWGDPVQDDSASSEDADNSDS